VELDFGKSVSFNRLLIQEFVNLGQRVKAFSLEKEVNGNWEKIAEGTTIGFKRILRFADTEAQKIRINFLDGKGIPVISEIGVFSAPALLYPPKITRTPAGKVTIEAAESELEIFFTTEGSAPKVGQNAYSGAFEVLQPTTVQAIVHDPKTGKSSDPSRVDFDLAKGSWKVISTDTLATRAIDELPNSYWTSKTNDLTIDLGQEVDLKGFTYLPMQARYPSGYIAEYALEISVDGKGWKRVTQGEFSNIQNSPIEQIIKMNAVKARFVRLKSLRTTEGNAATFGEFGPITR
jgi:alpha-L-fucosidase